MQACGVRRRARLPTFANREHPDAPRTSFACFGMAGMPTSNPTHIGDAVPRSCLVLRGPVGSRVQVWGIPGGQKSLSLAVLLTRKFLSLHGLLTGLGDAQFAPHFFLGRSRPSTTIRHHAPSSRASSLIHSRLPSTHSATVEYVIGFRHRSLALPPVEMVTDVRKAVARGCHAVLKASLQHAE